MAKHQIKIVPLVELTPVAAGDGAKRIQDREEFLNPVTGEMETAVVVCFRRFRTLENGRAVIALFPEICDDYRPGPCSSFMTVGGHAAARYHALLEHTRLARRGEEDVEEMIEILQRNYGYRLIVRERWDSSRNPQMPPPPMPPMSQGGPWDPSYYQGPNAVPVVPA